MSDGEETESTEDQLKRLFQEYTDDTSELMDDNTDFIEEMKNKALGLRDIAEKYEAMARHAHYLSDQCAGLAHLHAQMAAQMVEIEFGVETVAEERGSDE